MKYTPKFKTTGKAPEGEHARRNIEEPEEPARPRIDDSVRPGCRPLNNNVVQRRRDGWTMERENERKVCLRESMFAGKGVVFV
jgi:hypothetical protein